MATDAPWQTRWRSEHHYQGHYYDPVQAPPPPASAIGNQPSPTSLPSTLDSYSKPWYDQSRGEPDPYGRSVPSMIDPSADASTYHSRLHERHTSPGRRSRLTNSPSRQNLTQPWHSLPVDHHAQNRLTSDVPLTLHIPQTQDLPKLSSPYQSASAHARDIQPAHRQQQTSLPPFASISERADRADDPDEVEIAPMSARLSCSSCIKLNPLINDIAITVAELDENVQQYCNKSITRTLDFPKDDPIRAAKWILERLAKTKIDLQDTARRVQAGYPYAQPPTSYPGVSSSAASPPGALKRPADRWEQDELPLPKRPRSGASFSEVSRLVGQRDDRRASIDFAPRSPPPTESVPGSAYPRIGSPGLSARPHRTLPSPSSLAYPPSAAPSLVPATAPSTGSPSTSCQPAPSIHTASTNSATSAHIADLQHQVTLKSLALQTLQSEYASLLQKLQRERVKSQTIEKKTSVADQEVNELTGRNEDLNEQIKALEAQLDECEKKRESERLTAASERDQWTKLLALDRQLQSKNAEEKQKLREEKSLLSQRVAAYEDENFSRFDQLKRNNLSHTSTSRPGFNTRANGEGSNLTSAATADGFTLADASNDDVESLKAEVMTLKDRVEMLRYSLEEAKRRNAHLGEKSQELVSRHGDMAASIDRALEHDDATAKTNRPEGQALTSALSPTAVPEGHANSSRTLSQSTSHVESSGATQATAPSSTASMSSIARAVSPGPAELGFHVAPSTSTPEELIAALGPVPPAHFVAGGPHSKRSGNSAQRKKPRKRNPDARPESTNTTEAMHYGAFRPLEYPMPPAHSGTNQSGYLTTPFHSYASSPGSMAERSSPSSSGSDSRRSSGEERGPSNFPSTGQSTFTTGLPSPSTSADGWPASVMPPPPRPSMNLRDLCSMPTGSIARP